MNFFLFYFGIIIISPYWNRCSCTVSIRNHYFIFASIRNHENYYLIFEPILLFKKKNKCNLSSIFFYILQRKWKNSSIMFVYLVNNAKNCNISFIVLHSGWSSNVLRRRWELEKQDGSPSARHLHSNRFSSSTYMLVHLENIKLLLLIFIHQMLNWFSFFVLS